MTCLSLIKPPPSTLQKPQIDRGKKNILRYIFRKFCYWDRTKLRDLYVILPALLSSNRVKKRQHKQGLCNAWPSCNNHNPEFCNSQLCSNRLHTRGFLASEPVKYNKVTVISKFSMGWRQYMHLLIWLPKTYLTTKLICHEEVQHDNLQEAKMNHLELLILFEYYV